MYFESDSLDNGFCVLRNRFAFWDIERCRRFNISDLKRRIKERIGTRCSGAFSTGEAEEEEEMKREENRWRELHDGQRCVDARGGNSHETGGTRLAVLKLRPGPDWPCTTARLSHRSAFGKLARCRISETLARRVPRSMASFFSFYCHLFPFPFRLSKTSPVCCERISSTWLF